MQYFNNFTLKYNEEKKNVYIVFKWLKNTFFYNSLILQRNHNTDQLECYVTLNNFIRSIVVPVILAWFTSGVSYQSWVSSAGKLYFYNVFSAWGLSIWENAPTRLYCYAHGNELALNVITAAVWVAYNTW